MVADSREQAIVELFDFVFEFGCQRTYANKRERPYGAQGRNRTTDTVIFSHVLYQLSYLGAAPGGVIASARRL
jgi:hypothetical protein